MKALSTFVERLAFGMHLVSGVLLVSLMLTTIADVVSRMLFKFSDGGVDLTFFGGIEIVSFTLLFAILFSLPYSISRGQVIVDLFTENLNSRAKEFLSGLYIIGLAFLGIGMSIVLYQATNRVIENGETSQDLLIPLGYIYGTAAFASAVLAIRGLFVAMEQIMQSGKTS